MEEKFQRQREQVKRLDDEKLNYQKKLQKKLKKDLEDAEDREKLIEQ